MRQQSARAAGKLHGLSRGVCVCLYVYLSASVVPVPVRTVGTVDGGSVLVVIEALLHP